MALYLHTVALHVANTASAAQKRHLTTPHSSNNVQSIFPNFTIDCVQLSIKAEQKIIPPPPIKINRTKGAHPTISNNSLVRWSKLHQAQLVGLFIDESKQKKNTKLNNKLIINHSKLIWLGTEQKSILSAHRHDPSPHLLTQRRTQIRQDFKNREQQYKKKNDLNRRKKHDQVKNKTTDDT